MAQQWDARGFWGVRNRKCGVFVVVGALLLVLVVTWVTLSAEGLIALSLRRTTHSKGHGGHRPQREIPTLASCSRPQAHSTPNPKLSTAIKPKKSSNHFLFQQFSKSRGRLAHPRPHSSSSMPLCCSCSSQAPVVCSRSSANAAAAAVGTMRRRMRGGWRRRRVDGGAGVGLHAAYRAETAELLKIM